MRLNPLSPYLPKYPGPYQVGSTEIELPLPLELQRTFGKNTVKTLLVRLFYPTNATKGRRPRWTGQGNYTIQGYAKFLGIRQSLLGAASYLGLKWTEIPALSDTPLLPPATGDPKWPAMLFSHGLGGTRNAYSQISGSVASGGIVVMAIEHRDNSAAISVVKTESGSSNDDDVVEYISIKESTPENIQKRRDQLSQRAYEIRLGIELFRSLNDGDARSNATFRLPLHVSSFKNALDVVGSHRFLMAGHSFGAATSVDVCKDTTTRLATDSDSYALNSEFRASILLDLWTEVLIDSNLRPLNVPSLCVASEAFQKWNSNFEAVKTLLRPLPPPPQQQQQQQQQQQRDTTTKQIGGNRLCWIPGSAHLSQSDFQLLFPLATKYAFSASIDPFLAMQLNVRAVREFLRELGIGREPRDETIFHGGTELIVTPLE